MSIWRVILTLQFQMKNSSNWNIHQPSQFDELISHFKFENIHCINRFFERHCWFRKAKIQITHWTSVSALEMTLNRPFWYFGDDSAKATHLSFVALCVRLPSSPRFYPGTSRTAAELSPPPSLSWPEKKKNTTERPSYSCSLYLLMNWL